MSKMPEPLIEVKDLSLGYGNAAVVFKAEFAVYPNERVGIIGPNGCGKTTLLKALGKLIAPMSGEISICGKNLHDLNRRGLANMLAMLSQFSESWLDFSVLDTVLMGRYAKRDFAQNIKKSEDRRVARECIRTVGLEGIENKSIMTLSGGQLQRVMLARTLAQEPQVIVLDEPTNHLDLKYQAEIFNFLKDWVKTDGRCVIQAMHDLNLAMSFSDRILLMKEGVIIANDTPKEIMQSDILDETFEFGIREFMGRTLRGW